MNIYTVDILGWEVEGAELHLMGGGAGGRVKPVFSLAVTMLTFGYIISTYNHVFAVQA